MSTREALVTAVYESIDELNRSLPPERQLSRGLATSLQTKTGAVDSLGLTMLLVDLEQRVEKIVGTYVPLVDGSIASDEESPLTTVETLVSYIERQITAD